MIRSKNQPCRFKQVVHLVHCMLIEILAGNCVLFTEGRGERRPRTDILCLYVAYV